MKEEYVELATEIVEDQLATVINEYAVSQNQQANKLLEQKIEILQQIEKLNIFHIFLLLHLML